MPSTVIFPFCWPVCQGRLHPLMAAPPPLQRFSVPLAWAILSCWIASPQTSEQLCGLQPAGLLSAARPGWAGPGVAEEQIRPVDYSLSLSPQCCLLGYLPDPCLLPGTQVSPQDLDKEKGWRGAGMGPNLLGRKGYPYNSS